MGPASAEPDTSHPYANMKDTIQEQIKLAKETLAKSPTLEDQFDVIPDTVTVKDKTYCLRIEPIKGGITFVDFVNVDIPQRESLIHVESPSGIHDAMSKAIESLAEDVTDEWNF